MDDSATRQLHRAASAIHIPIYFAPESADEYRQIGIDDATVAYFASRAAPLGAVGAEIVTATFFNFCPQRVEAAIPLAWSLASPAEVQAARLRAIGSVMQRADVELSDSDIDEANAICEAICADVDYAGKPLAAGNRTVELPDDPLVALWQRLTTIREWRGDAHIAVLGAEPLSGLEALVLNARQPATSERFLRATRGWPDGQWDQTVAALTERGLLGADGELTESGTAFREQIEDRTDTACRPLADAVGETDMHRLVELVAPLREAMEKVIAR